MKAIHTTKINQLPEELLVEIFLLAQAPSRKDRYPHLRLSSVCRDWRRVINGYGLFWTLVFFSPWKGEQFIREFVTRSRSAKLSVFSPNKCDIRINNSENSRLDRAQTREIITTFNNLLQTEGHRIKFLDLGQNFRCILPRAGLAKAIPIMKTFIVEETKPFTENSDSFAVIKVAKSLENLNMNLHLQRSSIAMSSLSELKPSFECLRNLKLRFIPVELRIQIFISILPSCHKLESLIVSRSQYHRKPIRLPSVITLTNLILLKVDCYSLVHKLRAPALRRLDVRSINRLERDQHHFLILDEYNLSPVTRLIVRGYDILRPQNSSVIIEGLTSSKSCDEDPWTPFQMDKYTDHGHIDLRRENINMLSSGPTQFYFEVPTYHTPSDGVAPPDFKPSPALSKIFPKLHNLEELYITPHSMGHVPRTPKPVPESLKMFLNIVLGNLVSSKIKRLGIRVGRTVNILQLIFDLVNNCFSLSNLDTIEFGTSHSHQWHPSVSLHGFAEELVNCLKLRQKAGYRALPRFEVDLGAPLPENCVAEAAVLGTHVVQYRDGKGLDMGF